MKTLEVGKESLELAMQQAEQFGTGWVSFHPKEKPFRIDNYFPEQEEASDALLFSFTSNEYIEYTSVPHLREQLLQAQRELNLGSGDVVNLQVHCWETDHEFEKQLELKFMENQVLSDRQELNLSHLKKQVLNTGLPETWEFAIRENMEKGVPEFTVGHKPEIQDGTANVTGFFKKGKEDYFFNSFEVAAKYGDAEAITQNFYVRRPEKGHVLDAEGNKVDKTINSTFTLKEALNMLTPPAEKQRWVLKNFTTKEGEVYSARVSLDMSEKKDGNYPMIKRPDFDLEAKILNMGVKIKEMETPESAKRLIGRLNKGDIVDVTVISESNKEYKRSLMVNGTHSNVSLFDGKTLLSPSKAIPNEPDSPKQGNDQKKTNTQKQGAGDDADAGNPEQKKNKKKGVKI